MKKLVIAGASVALAAMPVLGAFAATNSTEFIDNLSVDVSAGCTMENSGNTDGDYTNRYFSKAIATGNFAVLDSVADADSGTTQAESTGGITIKCNITSGTVTVKATPANNGNLVSGSDNIIPGAQTSGSTSGWAIKSNSSNATDAGWANYAAAPTAEVTFLTATASKEGTTFSPSYQVYVAQGQNPGTYKGSVTYNVSYAPGA